MLFINYIIRAIEYFAVNGFPQYSLEELPMVILTYYHYISKLAYIYITYFTETPIDVILMQLKESGIFPYSIFIL